MSLSPPAPALAAVFDIKTWNESWMEGRELFHKKKIGSREATAAAAKQQQQKIKKKNLGVVLRVAPSGTFFRSTSTLSLLLVVAAIRAILGFGGIAAAAATAAGATVPPPPPPSLAIDCAVRHLALHFAATKLQHNPNQNQNSAIANDHQEDSKEQLQHVRDALRLYECRTTPNNHETENTNTNEAASFTTTTEMSRIRRRTLVQVQNEIVGESSSNHHHERKNEHTNNTEDPNVDTPQQVKEEPLEVTEDIVPKNENENRQTNTTSTTSTLYVDPVLGSDDEDEEEDTRERRNENKRSSQTKKKKRGSFEYPYRTIEVAVTALRRQRQQNQQQQSKNMIVLRGGWYYLQHTLQLDARDHNLSIQAYPNEVPRLSGGNLIVLNMTRTQTQNQNKQSTTNMYSAKLPSRSCPASSSPKSTTIPTPDGRSGENENDDTSRGNCDGNYNFTTLFVCYPSRHHDNYRGSSTTRSTNTVNARCRRLVWAREPNGNIEYDLQPDGYATANGTIPGGRTWPQTTGSLHLSLKTPARNSTVYPWFGEDRDPRGNGNWFHVGGTGDRFLDQKGFWNGTVPLGMQYAVNDLKNTHSWTKDDYAPAIVHIFQNGYWGNWQMKVATIHAETQQITFRAGVGGWQEGRGGSIGTQPYYIEGVKAALDVPGEWWLDVPQQILYYYPYGNETITTASSIVETNAEEDEPIRIEFIAPTLKRLISIVGNNNDQDNTDASNGLVTNITITGVTFTQTATTFMDQYEVPSPGDWSIRRDGAIFIENSVNVFIRNCKFIQLGGNGIFLSGLTKNVRIEHNELAYIGDSAIATVGRIDMADGYTVDTYPHGTIIDGNHIHDLGLIGKQTSALFSALTCHTTFINNVLYNGPRAGININDAFCHGHNISNNLIFNFVRETQDHGAINTWDRAMYVQKSEKRSSPNAYGEYPNKDTDDRYYSDGSSPSNIPQWTHIERNFIMNGPSGNRNLGNLFPTIDNDDGSSYYYMSNNFLVYGGAKNYLGHDKIWISNLFLHPGRWSHDPSATIWAGENHYFMNNTCVIASNDPPIYLDGTTRFFGEDCTIDWNDDNNLKFVGNTAGNVYYMNNVDDGIHEWGMNCGNGTSVSHFFTMEEMQRHGWETDSSVIDSKHLTVDAIIKQASTLLSG